MICTCDWPGGSPRECPRHRNDERTWSRRAYLLMAALLAGADTFTAIEAVSSTAIEHPEWDMDEFRTWDEWQADA